VCLVHRFVVCVDCVCATCKCAWCVFVCFVRVDCVYV